MKTFLQFISEADEQPEDANYEGVPELPAMTQPEMELYYQQYMSGQKKPILQKKPSKELENPEIAKMVGGSD